MLSLATYCHTHYHVFLRIWFPWYYVILEVSAKWSVLRCQHADMSGKRVVQLFERARQGVGKLEPFRAVLLTFSHTHLCMWHSLISNGTMETRCSEKGLLTIYTSQPVCQSITNQSINWSIDELINQSINQSIDRSINQSIDRLIYWLIVEKSIYNQMGENSLDCFLQKLLITWVQRSKC